MSTVLMKPMKENKTYFKKASVWLAMGVTSRNRPKGRDWSVAVEMLVKVEETECVFSLVFFFQVCIVETNEHGLFTI